MDFQRGQGVHVVFSEDGQAPSVVVTGHKLLMCQGGGSTGWQKKTNCDVVDVFRMMATVDYWTGSRHFYIIV